MERGSETESERGRVREREGWRWFEGLRGRIREEEKK